MSRSRTALAAALLLGALAQPALAGPPWVSIEYPANPFDKATKGALLTMHTYHHGKPHQVAVRGRAEAVVDGRRRTVALKVVPTSITGAYAVHGELPDGNAWVLVLDMTQEDHGKTTTAASVIAALAPDGRLAAVQVPSRMSGDGWVIPRAASAADVDAFLRLAAASPRAQTAALPLAPRTLAGIGVPALLLLGLAARRRHRRHAPLA